MRKYSIVIPVYNRPQEIKELLDSLTAQSYKNFEVLVVEDGSTDKCEEIVSSFNNTLDIKYYFKPNSGQGFSRNYGYERCTGDYYIVFDSDCIIPSNYLQTVEDHLNKNFLDAYGGPDNAHSSFTPVQKAINYSMTSIFTTGGMRGDKRFKNFHPRSFNMGISREVFAKTGGYILPKKGEDIEFSIRISKSGFKVGLIPDAYVFHKRRTNFRQFFKQLNFFGTARINIFRFFPEELRLIHFFPAAFTLACFVTILFLLIGSHLFWPAFSLIIIYQSLIFLDSSFKNKSLYIGALSVVAAFTQLLGYGTGFIMELIRYLIGKK